MYATRPGFAKLASTTATPYPTDRVAAYNRLLKVYEHLYPALLPVYVRLAEIAPYRRHLKHHCEADRILNPSIYRSLVLTVGVETEIRVVLVGGGSAAGREYACELQHRAQLERRVVTAERSDDGRCAPVGGGAAASDGTPVPRETPARLWSIYAVEPDLGGLIPLRGDLHTHTWYSDGSCAPGELLQTAWGLGLDFVAVTDHDNWEGSREAVVAGRSLPVTVIPGEEVAFNRGHVVAVGVSSGVMDRRRSVDSEAEVAALAETLCEGGEEAGFASQYARALWATRTIRALGGCPSSLTCSGWPTANCTWIERIVDAYT